MRRKSLRERIDDSIDYAALGITALAGIAIVLLRGKIAKRLNKRYGEGDEYTNDYGNCDADGGGICDSSSNKK